MTAELPPGPRMPSALQAVGWVLRPLPYMRRASERYGDVFTLHVRHGRPWVLLADPRDIKRVFTAAAETVRPAAVEINPLLGPLLGARSVMLLDEPEHMIRRRGLLPSFHGQRMHGYSEMIDQVTRQAIDGWPIGEPFALWPRMQAITAEVIVRLLFGDAEQELTRLLRRQLADLSAWLNNPRRLPRLMLLGPDRLSREKGFRAVMDPVEATVLAEARRRRACREERVEACREPQGEDILSTLEQAHGQDGSPMSELQLRDELVTLISDGPTSTSLAWAFERLLRHPDKLERLREETLEGEGEEYADAVVRETLRLCPIVPLVPRELLAPMSLGGYELPAHTIVAPCAYLVHRRADVYPDPLRFQPERFIAKPPPSYAWIPFGGGVRRCLAANFAQLVIKRVMQTVLGHLELVPARPQPGPAGTSAVGASGSARTKRGSVAFAPSDARAVVARRSTPRVAA